MAGNVPPPQADRPSLRLNIDLAAVARESGLQPMSERVFWPAPEAGSEFRRDWRPPGLSGDRHRGYALQWASFAAACLVLFLIFHVRRKESAR
jgi:cytochrome oxidase assembly protein ShyY1